MGWEEALGHLFPNQEQPPDLICGGELKHFSFPLIMYWWVGYKNGYITNKILPST